MHYLWLNYSVCAVLLAIGVLLLVAPQVFNSYHWLWNPKLHKVKESSRRVIGLIIIILIGSYIWFNYVRY